MKQLLILLLISFIGCTGTDEDAATNLKKGNDFLEKKEYEVAEYYYERIPESSPFYNEALKKLDVIAAIKKQWVEKAIPSADLSKITILKHTYRLDNTKQLPIHFLSIANDTELDLEYIDVEFTYLNNNNNVVGTLTAEVHTKLVKKSQDIFTNIKPGVVNEEFTSVSVRLVNARLK